ncbi:SufS family cysteine desulfurase [Thalassotalea psychrophila]|uniref:cysteine desulfurase n=1 Tax=Thalassotalea psychrophila TaxID=3065647 RepID=A0ABY9TPY7_9GAMM|nr:SufS family cysteine desulfurase [Colwelliaceae bacterium SQ149]
MKTFSATEFRKQFPILQTVSDSDNIIYFDNAATSQKPVAVINALHDFYLNNNANVHRASHFLSAKATKSYEVVRAKVQSLIKAKFENEIIWTKGTTESINLVAQSYGLNFIKAEDEIVISMGEHHANIVPWQHVAQQTGAKLIILPLDDNGIIDLSEAERLITAKCKLVAVNHISNVIGKINPVKQLITLAQKYSAKTLIDGAQAVAHIAVDVQELDCDFYVFSAHKMYGPTGVGVLYGKQALLESMPPYQFGGEMIKKVSFTGTTYNELPHRFEAGTPNIAGVVGLGTCLDIFIEKPILPMIDYEQQLCHYLYQQLSKIEQVQFLVKGCPDIPVFSFTFSGFHHQDVASHLDSKGIAVRAGHHCAMPLLEGLGLDGSIRVSLAAYNTFNEVDVLVKQLQALCLGESAPQSSTNTHIENEQYSKFITQEQVLTLFSKATSWDLKHREIMLLSKQLTRLNKEHRQPQDLISGCESDAWLVVNFNTTTSKLSFQADSNAKVIRGLMVIILSVYQHKTAAQIHDFDIEEYFQVLGLMQHLSPSRGNGIKAIVERIKEIAYNYQ